MADKTGKGQTVRIDARTLAALIGDPVGTTPYALGRKVNDKRVRSVARDTIDRFVNRTGYTAHDYTPDECGQIVTAMQGRGRGAPTTDADAVRAMHATPRKARKTARKARKASETAPSADAAQTPAGDA